MFKFKKGCDFPSRSLSIASNSSTVGGIFILGTTRSMEIKCINIEIDFTLYSSPQNRNQLELFLLDPTFQLIGISLCI